MRRRVDSPRNPAVQDAKRLKERRHRAETGRFLVEGSREVQRALAAGVAAETLFLAPELSDPSSLEPLVMSAEAAGAEVVELAAEAFERLSLRQGPDGIALIARTPDRSLVSATGLAGGLVLILDGLEKPGNVGALLRSADAAGVSAVVVTGTGTDMENPNVIRASQGSVFALPVYVGGVGEVLERLKAEGFRLVAASPHAERPHWEADLTGSVAIALGTEAQGLSTEMRDAADELVRIPMRSRAADSLNVSVAGAVVLYESLRQRS